MTVALSEHVRERTASGRRLEFMLKDLRTRRVPVRWSNLFGVVALASIVVLLVTGVILMFAYAPSSDPIVYSGSYAPLHGVEVSKAFDSVLRLTVELPGGLLLRQLHHWAALLLPAAIIMQLLVNFFTGAFRRPRRGSWVLLFLIFIMSMAAGWSGYALPDDMLSGSGLRIVHGIVLGIPVVGTWIATLLFGGEFPGRIVENLYVVHVIVPVALVGLLAVRGWLSLRHKSPQFAGPGRSQRTIVGVPMLPNAAIRAGGFMVLVTGVLVFIAANVTISPTVAPSDPGNASAGSQPDWYTGFLDGALRLVPPGWELELLGRTWTFAVLAPLTVIGVYMVLIAVYPFIEGWITRDRSEHHLLDRPRNTPTRTAVGVAGMTFYAVLWATASADVTAMLFSLTLESIIHAMQIALLVGPVVAFGLTREICLALQKRDHEVALHGFETGRIVRLPGGEYVEMHTAVNSDEQWRLAGGSRPASVPARPNEAGRLSVIERARGRLASFFFEDRIVPHAESSTEPVLDQPSATSAGTRSIL
ncbi:cytochrome bc complex cytochrome b subunit [Agreia sp.]|uniref:cytochrome bc1 complex cytochrome b subunit n=1 Tax=Agreia sp. TaxID=1872416 RepID=UPI0035BC41C1